MEATQAIPVGVYVQRSSVEHSGSLQQTEGLEQSGSLEQSEILEERGPEIRRVLEISIEFTPDKVLP